MLTLTQVLLQYPAADELVRLACQGWKEDLRLDEIKATVKYADKELLLHDVQFADGKSQHIAPGADTPEMQGTVCEVVAAVNRWNHVVGSTGTWSVDRDPGANRRVMNMLMTTASDALYLVQMVVICWYKYGVFVKREINVTVHCPPPGQFPQLLVTVQESIRLSMDDFDKAPGNHQEIMIQLKGLIRRFVDRVYTPSLRNIIDKCPKKGMSGVFGKTTLMSWVMAGRVRLKFSKGNDSIEFIAAEDGDPRMALLSISATLPGARAMVEEVIREWESSPLPKEKLYKQDPEAQLVWA